jgi:hypothetical protein
MLFYEQKPPAPPQLAQVINVNGRVAQSVVENRRLTQQVAESSTHTAA